MKDIDFDELDRAVGSVLQSGKKEPESTPVEPAAAAAPSAEPAATAAAPSAEEAAAPTTTRASSKVSSAAVAPALKRSSGRFMDVVHPSSDMKGKTTSESPAPRMTIAPLNPDVKPEGASSAEPMAEPTEPEAAAPTEEVAVTPAESAEPSSEQADVDTPVEPTVQSTDKSDTEAELADQPAWPDPLDVASQPSAEPTATTSEELAQTPFLEGAKVSKRPLGAFGEVDKAGDETIAAEPAPVEVEPTVDTEQPATEPAASSPLPAELQPEAVAVESKEIPEEDEITGAKPEPEPEPEPAAAPTKPQLNQSIAPQYKPEPTGGEDAAAQPVFDTEHYHQPLIAARSGSSRGKQTAMTLIMILLLLAVGAGLGYAAYIYTIGGFSFNFI